MVAAASAIHLNRWWRQLESQRVSPIKRICFERRQPQFPRVRQLGYLGDSQRSLDAKNRRRSIGYQRRLGWSSAVNAETQGSICIDNKLITNCWTRLDQAARGGVLRGARSPAIGASCSRSQTSCSRLSKTLGAACLKRGPSPTGPVERSIAPSTPPLSAGATAWL